jgi:hypothetical protein
MVKASSLSPTKRSMAACRRHHRRHHHLLSLLVILSVVAVAVVDNGCASSDTSVVAVVATVVSGSVRAQISSPSTSAVDLLRGGAATPGTPGGGRGPNDFDSDPNYQNALYTQPQSQAYDNNMNDDNENLLFQETVQDRVDRWRQEQMKYQPYGGATTAATAPYEHQHYQQTGFTSSSNGNSTVNLNPQFQSQTSTTAGAATINGNGGFGVDLNRLKLFISISKGSRALTFFVLMWRNIYMFDVADSSIQKSKSLLRLVVRTALTLLLCGNIAGFVTSILPSPTSSSSPSSALSGEVGGIGTSDHHHHSTKTKKRMKAILNLDKLLEMVLLVWYFFRLTIFPSKYVPTEVFIAGALHSVFFLLQCQATTRFVWDEGIQLSPKAQYQLQNQLQQQQLQRQQNEMFLNNNMNKNYDNDLDDYKRYASYDSQS